MLLKNTGQCSTTFLTTANDIHILMENLKDEYVVLAATSGEQELDMLSKERRTDAILLDVMMPGEDG